MNTTETEITIETVEESLQTDRLRTTSRGPDPTTRQAALESPEEQREKPKADQQNIARLPKETRDMINVMLDEGLPYHILLEELGEGGQKLTPQSLTDWVRGRHQDYLKNRQVI